MSLLKNKQNSKSLSISFLPKIQSIQTERTYNS